MAVNFNWVISQMECKNEESLSDVVVTIHWRRNASEKIEEKEYFAEVYGSISLKAPKKDQFIPYNELTKEQVEGWLNESLKVEDLDNNLVAQIEAEKHPAIVVKPLPWN